MTMFFMYLGGCAAIACACFLASKAFDYIHGPPQVVDEVTNEGPTTPSKDYLLAETLRREILTKKQIENSLDKQLDETKAKYEELQLRYREKYGVDLSNLSASQSASIKSSITKKRGIRTRNRESRTSCSSNDSSTLTPSTVIHKSSKNGTSIAETFVVDDTSSVYNSANNTGKEEAKSQNDLLRGKPEVAPNEKVVQWLQTNPERTKNVTHDQPVKNAKPNSRPKPVLMIIPVKDPPKCKASADSDCETYEPSSKRESPKTIAPHLYKRLNLRKKSSVALKVSEPPKRKSRKSEEINGDVSKAPKERVKKASIPRKSCSPLAELIEQKRKLKNENAIKGELKKSPCILETDEESERETLVNYICDAYSSSDSEHYIQTIRKPSFEFPLNTRRKKTIKETCVPVLHTSQISSHSSGRYAPCSGGKHNSVGKAKSLESSSQISRQPQTRSKKEIGEVLDVKSKSFDKRKSSSVVGSKRSKSTASQLSDSAGKENRCFGNDSDGEVNWSKTPNSSGKKKEWQTKSGRSMSSNRERLTSDGAISGEELDWRTKSKHPDKKKIFASKLSKKVSSSSMKPNLNTKVSDKKKEAPGKNNAPSSISNERPKTADNDKLSPKSLNGKSKEFLTKYRLRGSSCQDRSNSVEMEENTPIVNRFDVRKERQLKCHTKETSDKEDEKYTLSTKLNQFEKRREFQSKYHIKHPLPEDELTHSEKVPMKVSMKSNQYDNKKDSQAKCPAKSSYANQERPKSAANGDLMQHKSENRKTKCLEAPTRAKSHGNVVVPPMVKPSKSNVLVKRSTPNRRAPVEKEVPTGQPVKISPLQRRMEYDAKCRMKSATNLHKPISAATETLNEKIALREKKQHYNSQFRMKVNGSTLNQPVTPEKFRSTSPVGKPGSKTVKTGAPTMNRQPNDRARVAYVFNWESKSFAVEKQLDVANDVQQVSEPRKARESSVSPPAGKKLPPPRGVRRPLSAPGRENDTRSSSKSPSSKKSPTGMRKLATGSEDECRYLKKKKSSEWSLTLSNPSKGSLELEFDVKDLNDSNFSSSVHSEVSEETMIKDLQNVPVDSIKVGTAPYRNESEDEEDREHQSDGEFVMPKSQSAHLRNKGSTGSKLQNILDMPMDCGGASMNNNLLSRSDARLRLENEGTPIDNVFTGTMALKKSTKSIFQKGSREMLSVLTNGYKKLALDNFLGEAEGNG